MVNETDYSKEYYEKIFLSGGLRKYSINWWSVRFYALLARRILGERKARVIDVGCGLPFILARLEKQYETWGIDLSSYAIEKGKTISPLSRIIKANIEDGIPAEIPRNYFDLIVAKYLLEHLRKPEDVLKQCQELLAHQGRIIISVPNTGSPMRRLRKDTWFAVTDKTHLSLLEPSEWVDMVTRNGMEIEKVFSDGFWDVPYVKFLPAWLQYPIFSIPCAVEVFFAYPMLPVNWGENIMIIATKP